MVEVRFYGTGGHGIVVAAKILADAAAKDGYYVQSFASYGTARRGGQVESYVRVSDEHVLLHSKVYEPDYAIIMDRGLVEIALRSGMKENSVILINSQDPPDTFSLPGNLKVVTVDADRIAADNGLQLPSGLRIINTTMLGAIVGLSSIISLDSLIEAINESGIPQTQKNVKASQEANSSVKLQEAESAVAGEVKEVAPEIEVKARDYPVFHPEKMPHCNRCQICYILCPELAITFKANPFSLAINRDLCKGCGICIQECPRHAISWEGEVE